MYYIATELTKDKAFDVSVITADYGQDHLQVIKGVKVIKSLVWEQNPLVSAIKICIRIRRYNK